MLENIKSTYQIIMWISESFKSLFPIKMDRRKSCFKKISFYDKKTEAERGQECGRWTWGLCSRIPLWTLYQPGHLEPTSLGETAHVMTRELNGIKGRGTKIHPTLQRKCSQIIIGDNVWRLIFFLPWDFPPQPCHFRINGIYFLWGKDKAKSKRSLLQHWV